MQPRLNRFILAGASAFLVAWWATAPAGASASAQQQETYAGSALFSTYCSSCHGANATGDGPLASVLKKHPPDLTQIAKRNGGKFPDDKVFRTIDGRDPVRAHGSDMPVWGDAFTRSIEGGDPRSI